jgi:hypothetical protein
MKILFLCLFSTRIFAADLIGSHLGEWSKFSVDSIHGKGEMVSKITEFSTDIYKYIATHSAQIAGQNHISTEEIDGFDHLTAQTVNRFCLEFGGEAEILLIMGREHRTCKFDYHHRAILPFLIHKGLYLGKNKGHVWIGDFPVLGMARVESELFNLHLIDYYWKD